MNYSADSSAFINGWHKQFPPAAFQGLWDRLGGLAAEGRLLATEEVRFEIEKGADVVWEWVKDKKIPFVPHDEDIQLAVRDILRQYPRLLDDRTNKSGADPFVIALAKVRGMTVVTDEGIGSAKRPRIPDVCAGLGVKCINLQKLILEEGWRF